MRKVRALGRDIAKVVFILVFSTTWIFGAWPQVFEFPQTTSDALAQIPPWYNEDWQYRNEFTIDASKVAGAATSFPVLINSTREEWRSTSHSGNVGSATGWDFVFTGSDGFTKLDHEIEKFASSTGELVAWVRVPFLSSTSNTVLYAYYGNAASGDQQNVAGVWLSGYEAVYHLNTVFTDSTSNDRDGTDVGTADIGGIAGQARDFDGGSSDRIEIGTFSVTSSQMTMSAWVLIDSHDGVRDDRYISKADGTASINHDWMLGETVSVLRVRSHRDSITVVGQSTLATGQWIYVVGLSDGTYYDGDDLARSVFVNGSIDGLDDNGGVDEGGPHPDNTNAVYIGNQPTDPVNAPDGRIDEVRISNVLRSASWIATEYANQSSPETFYSIDPSEPLRGANASHRTLTLSDSRPSQPANHTFNFTVANSITASTTLEFKYPTGFSFTGASNWYSNSWGFRKKVEIDRNKVAGAATSFPVLINATDWEWKDVVNGGHVGTTSGWDFVFTSDNGTTKLDHEIESFASSTGALTAWVRVPFLSSTSNTVLYAYYGNAASGDQQNVAAVWGNAFQAVFHLPENPTTASPQFRDSVANSKTGTSNGGQVSGDQQAGKIDGAINFDGVNDYINVADNAKYDLAATGKYAWSLWVKPDDFEEFNAVWVQNQANAIPTFDIYVHTTSDTDWGPVTQGVTVGWVTSGGQRLVTLSQDNVFQVGTLSHVLVTYDGALTQANRFKIYVDGADVTAGNARDDTAIVTITTATIRIGANVCCAGEAMDGVIDEMRFANSLRTQAWIATEYANQSEPYNFYTISPEEYQSVFDCADVDVATGTEFILGISSNCVQTATTWGVTVSPTSRTFTITSPSSTGVYVATGTEMTVRIGTNASSQEQGNSKIINPSSAGTYRVTLSGTAGVSGDFRVSVNEGLTVEASVGEHLSFTINGVPNWYNASWSYRNRITIDAASVSGTTGHANFPVLVNSTQLHWRDTTHGGNVASATGWDFVFTDSNGTTKLDHEIESFASSTGALVAWVRVPFLSSTSNTVLYAYYGGPTTTDQQNKHGVWDANFKGVWHMSSTTTNTTLINDSTALSNTGTKVSATEPTSASTGQVDGTQDFDGNNDNIAIGNEQNFDFARTQPFSISAWFWRDTEDTEDDILEKVDPSALYRGFALWLPEDNTSFTQCDLVGEYGCITFQLNGTGGGSERIIYEAGPGTIQTGKWYHVAGTYDGSSSAAGLKLYINGVQPTNMGGGGPLTTSMLNNNPVLIGDDTAGDNCCNFDGRIDEVRISDTVRSGPWIATEYNNQSSPGTFYSIGDREQAVEIACAAQDGASVSIVNTGAQTVAFGTINANTFYQGCHDLIVSTNAAGGYSLAGRQNHQLMTSGGTILPDTTCNTGTCTATTGATWTTATNNGLGHTCNNQVGNDCVSNYGDGLYFRQFADESAGETPVSIMASTTPAIATSRVKYRLSRGANQPAGAYTNTISYSLMATY